MAFKLRRVASVAVVCFAFHALAGDALVGAQVGNADLLVSEGSKLYNRKQHLKAAEAFLRASRANPSALGTYLQLARSLLAAKQVQRACYVYRVYLKASGETPDRKKAQAEADLCERQLKSAKGQPPDLSQKYVDTKAAFFSALDQGLVLGASGAYEQLKSLVSDGFVGPELGDLAAKLGKAAASQGDDLVRRSLEGERLDAEVLQTGRPLYGVAVEVGVHPANATARMAFLDGMAALNGRDYKKAETAFAEASKADHANKEYAYFRAMSQLLGGDKSSAMRTMEQDLKDDPRTAVLRTVQAINGSGDLGAAELEKLLFAKRFSADNS